MTARARVVFLFRQGHVRAGSKRMRVDQLSAMATAGLGHRATFEARSLPGNPGKQERLVRDLSGALVILLKRADRALTPAAAAALRDAARGIAIDYVDAPMRPAPALPVDVEIAASDAGLSALRALGRPAHACLLRHHADPGARLRDHGAAAALRLVYLGRPGNTVIPGEVAGDVERPDYAAETPEAGLARLSEANMHYAVRPEPGRNRKLAFTPFTKGAVAAAMGAQVLVNRQVTDAEAMLGADYPFFAEAPTGTAVADAVARARDAIGGPAWRDGLDRLAAVRAATGPRRVLEDVSEVIDALA